MDEPEVEDLVKEPDDEIYVHWRGGVWKIITGVHAWADMSHLKIRWVRGYKPDKGIFQIVQSQDITVLTAMESLGLMMDDEIVP